MPSLARSALLAAAPAWLLFGCLVSFNDYPLGALDDGAGMNEGGSGVMLTAGTGTGGGTPEGATGGGGSEGATGGTGGGKMAMPAVSENLIDDFEDGDDAIREHAGRSGIWYVANDGFGPQTPRAEQPLLPVGLKPARGASKRGLHTTGGPFGVWGALIGTALALDGDEVLPYDLSGYSGVRLWLRAGSQAPGVAQVARVNFVTPATKDPPSDHFGVDIELTPEWQQVEVPFESLEQLGFGFPLPAPDLTQVLALQFFFERTQAFDLWVDDIELY